MRFLAYFLVFSIAAGCVLEDRPVTSDGGADGGPFCVDCGVDTPVCNEDTGLCVQCTPDEANECGGDTPFCDRFECVACVADSDCTDPTEAKCDDMLKECVECDDRAQCDNVEGFLGTANACSEGECVDCTPESEDASCPGDPVWFVCDPDTNTCTSTPAGSRAECETCVFDSECGDGGVPSEDFRCVPMYYPDESTRFPDADTGFCLKIFEPGGCQRPYAVPITDRQSLSDSTLRSYCGIDEALTTCPAVNALRADDECPGGDDAECPTGGLCRDLGLPNRCTYLCGLPAQCPAVAPADTCGNSGSGSDDFCGG